MHISVSDQFETGSCNHSKAKVLISNEQTQEARYILAVVGVGSESHDLTSETLHTSAGIEYQDQIGIVSCVP